MFQQRPSPAAGGTFQRAWLGQRYRELPALTETVQAVESAFKEGVGSDYSVIAPWGTDGRSYYLVDLWRDRVQYPELRRAVQDQYARWRPDAMLVEDKASGRSVIQELRRETNLPIVAVPTKGSKQNRADTVATLFEAGKVWLPEYASWVAEWIEEHVAFPRATHDDQVDTTSMGLARLRGATGSNLWPMSTAGEIQGTRPNDADAVLNGILRQIEKQVEQEQGGAAGQQGGEPELTQAQLEHAAGLARMLGRLGGWDGPRWG